MTVCPHSNVKLRVFDTMKDHNIRKLIQKGLCASIHSDDPAYFGGYIGDNYTSVVQALHLDQEEILQLAKNAIDAAFLTPEEKTILLNKLEESITKHQ